MAFIPQLKNELVSVSLTPDSIACSWIQKNKNSTVPLILRSHKTYTFSPCVFHKEIVFNQTIIAQHISSFLKDHNLLRAFITLSIDNALHTEKFIPMPTSTPSHADFTTIKTNMLLWNYDYLYPDDAGNYIFYVYALSRFSILQYQLCAIANNYNLISLVPKTIALLFFYKFVFGTAFRTTQLAIDMMENNNNVGKLISCDALNRTILMPFSLSSSDEFEHIATACGLFYMEKER